MRKGLWMGAAVAVCAVVVTAGAAGAMTGDGSLLEPDDELGGLAGAGEEDNRRAQLENLMRLDGEPYTDEDVDKAVEEEIEIERQYPQVVQGIPMEEGNTTDNLIINAIEEDQ